MKVFILALLMFGMTVNGQSADPSQIIFGGCFSGGYLTKNATNYYLIMGSTYNPDSDDHAACVVPTNGSFDKLGIKLTAAPGSGKSWVFTVMKNGSATDLTVTIANTATSGTDTAHSISYSAGDTISMRITPSGTPATTRMSSDVAFTPVVAGETIFMGGNRVIGGSCFSFVGEAHPGFGFTWSDIILPCSGTVKNFYARSGSTQSADQTFTVYKNESATDLALTVSTGNSTASDLVHTVSVNAGDEISAYNDLISSVTGDNMALSCVFVPTVAGNFVIPHIGIGGAAADIPANATTYYSITGGLGYLSATESLVQSKSITAYVIKNIYVDNDSRPGDGKSYAYTLRLNGADTALTVTVSGQNWTGNYATDISIADGDLLDTKIISDNNVLGAPFISYLGYIEQSASSFGAKLYQGSVTLMGSISQ